MDAETERIASVAAERFHACGITATGVADLSRAARISKRTLYQRFGSKDGLVVAAYEALDEPVYRMFTARIEAEVDDPREQIDAFFAQLEPLLGSPEFRGCPFTNAASELPNPRTPRTQSSAATRSDFGAGYAIVLAQQEQRNLRSSPAA